MRNLIVFFSIALTGWSWGQEVMIYETGFESSEGFAAGTNYQTSITSGPTGQEWFSFYGTPSTTGAISGGQSMQMRWYTSAPSNLGRTQMEFDLLNVTKVEFLSSSINNINVNVSYSTNGGVDYIGEELFILTTSATIRTYEISATGEFEQVRVKFEVSLPDPAPESTSRLYIDDIKVYGIPPSEPIINATPLSLIDLNYDLNYGPSESTSFNVSGLNLDPTNGSIVIDATGTEYEVSTDDESFSSSVSLAYTAGELENTIVYTRLKSGLSAGLYTDILTVSGGDADAVDVNVSGRVFGPLELTYTNPFRTTDDFETAQEEGFDLSTAVSAGSYTRITTGGYITTPIIDFTLYDGMEVEVDLTTFGGTTGQVLSFQISNDGGETFSTVESFELTTAGTVYNTYNVVYDVTGVNNVVNGRFRFAMTAGTNQIRFRDFSITEFTEKIWGGNTDSDWSTASNWFPSGVPTADASIQIPSGTDFSPIVSGNLVVAATGSIVLESGAQLTINGAIENDGTITIESGATLLQTGSSSNSGSGVFNVAQAFRWIWRSYTKRKRILHRNSCCWGNKHNIQCWWR
jgi:hypothetical protein